MNPAGAYDARFFEYLAALRAWQRQHDSCDVPSNEVVKGEQVSLDLGRWVAQMRSRGRVGRLSAGRMADLEAVPGWDWEPRRRGPAGLAERNAEIRRLRSSGATLDDLARRYGLTRQRIHQICLGGSDPD